MPFLKVWWVPILGAFFRSINLPAAFGTTSSPADRFAIQEKRKNIFQKNFSVDQAASGMIPYVLI